MSNPTNAQQPVRFLEAEPLLTALREHLVELEVRLSACLSTGDPCYVAYRAAAADLRSRLTDLDLDPPQDPEEGT